jgi:hypothetical protein
MCLAGISRKGVQVEVNGKPTGPTYDDLAADQPQGTIATIHIGKARGSFKLLNNDRYNIIINPVKRP